MKAILLVVIVAIIGWLYMQTQRPIPTAAMTPAAQGLLHFTGNISQHVKGGGLLVSCVEWKPYLNKGHGREEVTGVFFVEGLPGETTLPNGRAVEFDGSPTGLYRTWPRSIRPLTVICSTASKTRSTAANCGSMTSWPLSGAGAIYRAKGANPPSMTNWPACCANYDNDQRSIDRAASDVLRGHRGGQDRRGSVSGRLPE